jgi:glutaredoxin 3
MNTTQKTVEIYSTPSCHFCQMAKEFFKENNIAYTNYDVSIDTAKREEMMDKSGQLGVPVIIIDDKDLIVGFDRKHVAELLGIAA